jgi:pimeloyl-ACP methyl ester carboxylesterase
MSSSNNSSTKPTIVFVHGAFADSSSWNGVIAELLGSGFPVVAAANPLRSVAADARSVAGVVKSIAGPVVLVGHSYGGAVISNAVEPGANVKALVFVAAFAPEKGETCAELSGRYPGGTLGPTLAPPVPLPGGDNDLYIQQPKFAAQFAADVSPQVAKLMAATQRPITASALNEGSGEPAWKQIPSWFIYGDRDLNIPAAALGFMAERARSKETVVIKGGSHAFMAANAAPVAALITRAAGA